MVFYHHTLCKTMTQNISQTMSLYIPHVFGNISKERIANTFYDQDIGKVSSIDFVEKIGKNNAYYNSAYIHFEYWFENDIVVNIQARIMNPDKQARIMYEDPWYWIVLLNSGEKIVSGQRKKRIDLSGLTKPENVSSNSPCDEYKDSVSDLDYPEIESESFDLVDAKYAEQLEEVVKILREQATAMNAVNQEYIFRESLLNDEIECLKNQISLMKEFSSIEVLQCKE